MNDLIQIERSLSDPTAVSERIFERLLVVRAQSGDRAAFDALVDRYQSRTMYYLRRLVGDLHAAQDLLQEVWLEVFRKLGRLRAPEAFRVWLYRIAHDRAVRHLRRLSVEVDFRHEMAVAENVEDSDDEFQLLDNAELVHRALATLSVSHRAVITLRFLEGMDVSEIARVMNSSEGTTKSRLHYAKAAVRRFIEERLRDG